MTGRRVALVTTHYPPLVGGAATYFSLLSAALARRGLGVTVLTTAHRDRPDVEREGAVEIWRRIPAGDAGPAVVRRWAQAVATVRWLRALRVAGALDVIHVHGSKSVTVGAAAYSAISGVPIVYDVQDFFSRPRVLRRGANPRYVVTGNPLANHVAAFGIERARILVVPSIPPDAARGTPAPRERNPSECRLLFVGELTHVVKGTDVLLRAMAQVNAGNPGVRLSLVGDGRDRAADEAFVREQGLSGVVDFVGALAAERVLAEIDRSDVVVLASRSEGMPRIILEAFARGVPVIATRVGGIPEAVRDGETGLLVPPENPAALAAAILTLAENPALRMQLGATARAWIDTLPTWDRLADMVAGVYGEGAV